MGRDKLYPDEWNIDLKSNAVDLIKRVNNLLEALSWDQIIVSSGWRPLAVNQRASGAKRSLHMIGKAVDLADKSGLLDQIISEHPEYLIEFGLWLEDPKFTPGWTHLDCSVDRTHRPIKIFIP